MAIIYSYPLNQPKRDDLLIGTITYDEDAVNPVHGNPTVSFTIGSLLNLVSGQGNIQNLQQVTNIGNTTTNSIIVSNSLKVSGGYYDSSNQPGTAGQLLSSTATGTQWVNVAAQGVTSVGLSMPAAFTVTNSPITQAGTLTVAGAGIAAQYINGAGNLATLLDIPGLITSLTTNGTSGVSTLVGSVLNIPNYAKTETLAEVLVNGNQSGGTDIIVDAGDHLALRDGSQARFGNGDDLVVYHDGTNASFIVSSSTTLPLQVLSDDFQVKSFTSSENMILANGDGAVELYHNAVKKFETTSTGIYVTGSGVFTQSLIINTGDKLFFDNGGDCYISEDTTGRLKFVVDGSEFMRLGDGIPDTITFYKDSTFSGSLTSSGVLNVSGSGQDGYLYVSGNAGNPTSTAPTHAQGFAFAYNNSGGSRECEVFWNTGTTTAAINNVSYLGFYNEFLNSDAGNARVTDTQLKLYGTGELELVGATPTISNPYWRMPTTAAPNTGYVLAKANGSINLEWVANGGSIYQTTNITVSAAQLSALNGSPITLLPAPGVGKTYHFNQIFFWFEAGSVVYNFGGMGTGIGFISVTGLFGSAYSGLSDMDSASSSMVNQGRNFNYMNIDPATANAAVILTPFQGTNPNPTQGNGILYISISYEIKDLGPTIQAN
jgi:hypothetical protein